MLSINPINDQNYFPNPTGNLDFLKMKQDQGKLDAFKNILERGKTSNGDVNTDSSSGILGSQDKTKTANSDLDGKPAELNTEKNNLRQLERDRLMQASKAFEALLIKEVFKSMRKNLNGDQLIGENSGTRLFKDFLFSERSQIAANQSDLGIAKIIFDQQSRYLQ